MLGRQSGFRSKVAEKNSKTRHLYCMLYRYALASKALLPGLRLILADVVLTINTMKLSFLNKWLFFPLCQELESDQKELLLH